MKSAWFCLSLFFVFVLHGMEDGDESKNIWISDRQHSIHLDSVNIVSASNNTQYHEDLKKEFGKMFREAIFAKKKEFNFKQLEQIITEHRAEIITQLVNKPEVVTQLERLQEIEPELENLKKIIQNLECENRQLKEALNPDLISTGIENARALVDAQAELSRRLKAENEQLRNQLQQKQQDSSVPVIQPQQQRTKLFCALFFGGGILTAWGFNWYFKK